MSILRQWFSPRDPTATPTAAAGIRQVHLARGAEEAAVLHLWPKRSDISEPSNLRDGARKGKSALTRDWDGSLLERRRWRRRPRHRWLLLLLLLRRSSTPLRRYRHPRRMNSRMRHMRRGEHCRANKRGTTNKRQSAAEERVPGNEQPKVDSEREQSLHSLCAPWGGCP